VTDQQPQHVNAALSVRKRCKNRSSRELWRGIESARRFLRCIE
jgi:hypothetical protein